MTSTSVPISVVICTRDRPDDLGRCLDAVKRLEPQPMEVIVVDQGSMPSATPVYDAGIRHQFMRERGLSLARNEGLALARAGIVAFLDDDCVVGPTWAADVAAVFNRHPDAGIVFGTVVASSPAIDAYVPVYSIPGERRLVGRRSAATAHGMGAAMYVRGTAAAVVGEFDSRLGAGAELRSSEDWDYTFRALAAGIVVIETPTVVVQHHGARRYSDGSAAELLRWNAFSHGAVHSKLLRCFDAIAVVLMATELLSLVTLVRPLNAVVGRPTNAARLVMYVLGFAAGWRIPVRRRVRLFSLPAKAG
jgi:GT2 family glycosyltransferase